MGRTENNSASGLLDLVLRRIIRRAGGIAARSLPISFVKSDD